jgi:hypothetical protein
MKEEQNGVVQAKDGVGASTPVPRMILPRCSSRRGGKLSVMSPRQHIRLNTKALELHERNKHG